MHFVSDTGRAYTATHAHKELPTSPRHKQQNKRFALHLLSGGGSRPGGEEAAGSAAAVSARHPPLPPSSTTPAQLNHSRPAQPLPPSSTTPAQLNHSHPAQPLPPSSSTPAQLIHSRPAHPLLLGFSTAPVSPDPAQFPLPPGSPTPTRFPRGLQLSLVWFPIPHLHSAPPLHHSPSNGAGLSLIISWRQKLSTMERIWSNFLH